LEIEIEREADGRWLADIPILPGVMAYGATREQAIANVKVLALRVIAEKSNMANARRMPLMPSSPFQREHMADRQRQARTGGSAAHRLANQAPIRFPSVR
jgi:predicted RNase H-like HicB family nuclease